MCGRISQTVKLCGRRHPVFDRKSVSRLLQSLNQLGVLEANRRCEHAVHTRTILKQRKSDLKQTNSRSAIPTAPCVWHFRNGKRTHPQPIPEPGAALASNVAQEPSSVCATQKYRNQAAYESSSDGPSPGLGSPPISIIFLKSVISVKCWRRGQSSYQRCNLYFSAS